MNNTSGYTQKKSEVYPGEELCYYECGSAAKYKQHNGRLICKPSCRSCPAFAKSRHGKPKSDLSGQTFDYWTVLNYIAPTGNGDKGGWLCRCICGTEQQIRGESLKKGRSKSCGCKSVELISKARTKPDNYRVRNDIYRNYRRSAKKRGYGFELSFDEFSTLISGACYYCNTPPDTFWNDEFSARASEFYKAEKFYYNGVDRVDNTVGYTLSNCVPACTPCNRAKHIMTVSQWLRWVKRLYDYQQMKGNYASKIESQPTIGNGQL